MTARSAQETLESLRVTLQRLEQASDLAADRQDIAELKQILLNRIAELETLNSLQPQRASAEKARPLSDLPALPVATAEDPVKETAEAASVEKLD
jgi:hypothetical protein